VLEALKDFSKSKSDFIKEIEKGEQDKSEGVPMSSPDFTLPELLIAIPLDCTESPDSVKEVW